MGGKAKRPCPVCGKPVGWNNVCDHAELHALELGAQLVDPRWRIWKLRSGSLVAGTGYTLLRSLARETFKPLPAALRRG